MTHDSLAALSTEDFDVSVGPILQAEHLWRRLNQSIYVRRLREALNQGEVTDHDVGDFVSTQVSQFRSGERLNGELALAAIAVALESRWTTFADEYLNILSGLRLAELGSAPRVAAVSRRHREVRPSTYRREVRLGSPVEQIEIRSNVQVPPSQRPMSFELSFDATP